MSYLKKIMLELDICAFEIGEKHFVCPMFSDVDVFSQVCVMKGASSSSDSALWTLGGTATPPVGIWKTKVIHKTQR